MDNNSLQERNTTSDLRILAEVFKKARQNGEIIDKKFYDNHVADNKLRGCPDCNYLGMIEVEPGVYEHCHCAKEETLKIKMRLAGLREIYDDIKELTEKHVHALRVQMKKNPDGTIEHDEKGQPILIDEKVPDIDKFISNYRDPEKLKKVRERGIDLIIEGPVGVGKTTMAHIIGRYALLNGYTVLFVELELLRKVWLKKEESLDEYERKIKEDSSKVDFLILDDLGDEYMAASGSQIFQLDLLLRTRKSKKMVTIMTTNLPEHTEDAVDNLRDRYKERIASILKQKRIYIVLHRTSDIREEQDDEANFLFE